MKAYYAQFQHPLEIRPHGLLFVKDPDARIRWALESPDGGFLIGDGELEEYRDLVEIGAELALRPHPYAWADQYMQALEAGIRQAVASGGRPARESDVHRETAAIVRSWGWELEEG